MQKREAPAWRAARARATTLSVSISFCASTPVS